MATYVVTTSNWNDPAFWSSISETTGGQSIDFSGLPAGFTVDFDKSTGLVTISDGVTTFSIGDATYGGSSDATLGGTTEWEFFDDISGAQGDNTYTAESSATPTAGTDGTDNVSGGAGNDSIDGGSGNDTYFGGDGSDTINGGGGDDYIDGGAGDDSLSGGDGDDFIESWEGNDSVAAGEGNDFVYGHDGDDKMSGGGGADTLFGEAGADSIDGGSGADDIDGGSGNDSIDGGTGNDSIFGGIGDDTILGGDGDDLLNGGAGDDWINGGTGDDTILLGDDGNTGRTQVNDGDNLQGTSGLDAFEWAGGAGNFATIRFNESADAGDSDGVADYVVVTNANDAGTLTIGDFDVGLDAIYIQEAYTGIKSSTGDYFGTPFETFTLAYANGAQQTFEIYHDGTTTPDPAVIFSTAAPPTAIATEGNDSVTGGSGADSFVVEDNFGNDTVDGGSTGTDNDTIDLSALTGAVTVAYTGTESGTITDGSNTLTFKDIENLILTEQADTVDASDATGAISIDLGAGDDSITDGDGDDYIVAGDGDDYIMANDGDDTIEGGAGDDDIEGGDGADSIDGGDGNDFLAGYDVAGLASHNTNVNTDDRADDTLSGGAGDDTLLGGLGEDVLDGGTGADSLLGGGGHDTITGGTGNDILTGNKGDDTFVYTVGDGLDTITDFNNGNSGALWDGDPTNNDFIDLSAYYDHFNEVRDDWSDDGILNQSNTTGPGAVDYSDNTQMAAGDGIVFQGASRDSFTVDNTGVVCFTNGTAIATPRGEVLIEDLRVGDLVNTLDNGPQRLVWIASRQISAAEMVLYPTLRPIRIETGILGNTRPLLVSRQHGMLLGEDHFARAIHLAKSMRGVGPICRLEGVTYIHLMFEAHEVVFANGIPSESFYPGPHAVAMLGAAGRAAVAAYLPRLDTHAPSRENARTVYGGTARAFFGRRDVADWTLRDRPEVALAG